MFLIKKQDLLAIKFLLKNNKSNTDLNSIIKFHITNISKEVANDNFYKVEKEIKKLMNIFKKNTEKNNNKIIDNFNTKYRKRILDTGIKENIKIIITIPQHQKQINKKNNYDSIKKYDYCLRPWKSLFIDIDEYIRPDLLL